MKRVVLADKRLSSKKENVRKVCDFMDWRMPMFSYPGANGYICKWGGKSIVSRYGYEQVQKWCEEIAKGTGIDCSITRTGHLVIPYAN